MKRRRRVKKKTRKSTTYGGIRARKKRYQKIRRAMFVRIFQNTEFGKTVFSKKKLPI